MLEIILPFPFVYIAVGIVVFSFSLFPISNVTFKAFPIFKDISAIHEGVVSPSSKVNITISINIDAKSCSLLSDWIDLTIVCIVIVVILFD